MIPVISSITCVPKVSVILTSFLSYKSNESEIDADIGVLAVASKETVFSPLPSTSISSDAIVAVLSAPGFVTVLSFTVRTTPLVLSSA